MNERDLVAGIEGCTIRGSDFRHADHVQLAWIYLRDYPLLEAIARFTTALRRIAAHHGVPEKYHETVTWAYLLLIHERMRRSGAPQEWERFRAENEDLFARRPSILDRYYARATLESDVARKSFVLPDAQIERTVGSLEPVTASRRRP
jgi:hypothetical protein